jgi:putative DNA primase/helicase
MALVKYLNLYLELGFTPVPVKHRDKNPLVEDWPNIRRDEIEDLFSSYPKCNIGSVLGNLSGGIIDIDLDSEEALKLGPMLLPKTDFRFGRASKPNSHHIYRIGDSRKTKQFKDPSSGAMIVEFRGNGGHTVFPGSVHETGEPIEFCGHPGDPAEVDGDSLHRRCVLVAIGSLIIPHWNQGSRHALSLAVSGLLAKAGISREDASDLMLAIASAAADPEIEDRLTSVETTYDRFEANEPIEFLQTLSSQLGAKAFAAARRWLNAAPENVPQPAEASVQYPVSLDRMNTDIGAGQEFARAVGDGLIYADDLKTWHAANSNVYEVVSHERVMGLAIGFIRAVSAQINSTSHLPTIKSLSSVPRLKALIDVAKPELRADYTSFDSDPWIAGCHGGVLDLRERRLIDPETVVTKRLGTRFDPDAKCPTFESFLDQIFASDREVIEFVRRAVGYTLTGRTSEQCLFILIGSGANGKSTFLKILGELLGGYAASIPMHTLMVSRYGQDRTDDLAALRGSRFVAAQEGEVGERLAEAKIKLMTGGDPISCRRLYQAYETYVPQFKVWLATNDLPRIQGTADAIWRRIHVLPFPVTIPPEHRDGQLFDKLVAELPGILNWALDGLSQWTEVRLSPPEAVTGATGTYRRECDTVAEFVDSCCLRDSNGLESVKSLYFSYSDWCDGNGVQPVAQSVFGKELSRMGFETLKANTGNKKKGLRLITSAEGAAQRHRFE